MLIKERNMTYNDYNSYGRSVTIKECMRADVLIMIVAMNYEFYKNNEGETNNVYR